MKLEEQIVSLEYAEKLKRLGLEKESYFCWWVDVVGGPEIIRQIEIESRYPSMGGYHISAFTVAELGKILPKYIVKEGHRPYDFVSSKEGFNGKVEWSVRYENGEAFMQQSESSEADARAKMLIYLLENNLLCV